MSKLGKILLWVALVGALAAVGAGVMLTLQYTGTRATLAQTEQEKTLAEAAAKKADAEAKAAKAAQADDDSKLSDANKKIDDLNTQLTQAQKDKDDATAAVASANDKAKTAQDALDAINKTLNGQTPDELVAATAKAQDDLKNAQSEQKILQDSLQAATQQVASLQDSLRRSKTGTMPPVAGKVTFVDHTWNFVVLNIGLTDGVVPNGELIVYRGRDFLGKVRVTKADPNDAVAEILPDIKGDIQIGDTVLN
jgi:chemotaxis protein histidine kinase CheA